MTSVPNSHPIYSIPIIFWLSLIISICLIFIKVILWTLPELIFIVAYTLDFIVTGAFFLFLFGSIVYVFFNIRVEGLRALIPFLINAATLVLLYKINFTQVSLNLNFSIFLPARQEVIKLIEVGELKPNKSDQVALPIQYSWVSTQGSIRIENSQIIFYTLSGINNYSGFVYDPKNQGFKIGQKAFNGQVKEVQKYRDQWYWISGI